MNTPTTESRVSRLEQANDTVLGLLQVHSEALLQLGSKFDSKFDKLESKFDKLESKFDKLADDVAVVKGDVAWIRKKLS